MATQQRLVEVFVELADTLVDTYDVIDFLHTLTESAVELLEAQAAGLMLADQRGDVQVVAFSSEESRTLELFDLQHEQGPCIESYRLSQQVVNVDVGPWRADASSQHDHLKGSTFVVRLALARTVPTSATS